MPSMHGEFTTPPLQHPAGLRWALALLVSLVSLAQVPAQPADLIRACGFDPPRGRGDVAPVGIRGSGGQVRNAMGALRRWSGRHRGRVATIGLAAVLLLLAVQPVGGRAYQRRRASGRS